MDRTQVGGVVIVEDRQQADARGLPRVDVGGGCGEELLGVGYRQEAALAAVAFAQHPLEHVLHASVALDELCVDGPGPSPDSEERD